MLARPLAIFHNVCAITIVFPFKIEKQVLAQYKDKCIYLRFIGVYY